MTRSRQVLEAFRAAWPFGRRGDDHASLDTPGALMRDSVAYVVSKVIPGLAGLATVLVFVRMIGSAEYGRYALALATVNLAAAFFAGWVNQAVLRYHSRIGHLESTARAIRVALGLSLAAGIPVIVVMSRASTDPYTWSGSIVVALLFASVALYQYRLVLFQALLKPRMAVGFGAVQAMVGVFLPVVLFLTVAPTSLAALAGLAGSYALVLAWRSAGTPSSGSTVPALEWQHETRSVLLNLWRYGWPMSFWFAATAVLPVSDRFFLQHNFGFATTGSYAALYDAIVRSYSLLLMPITMASHPRMMRQWNRGERESVWAMWRWAMGAQVIASVCMALVAIPFRGWIVRLVVPQGGQSLGSLVLPLLAGGFLWQFAMLVHKPLEIASKTTWMLGAAILALIINLVTNGLLLPRYGVLVTAYGTVASALAYIGTCRILATRILRGA